MSEQHQQSDREPKSLSALTGAELAQATTFFRERLVGQPEVVNALTNVLFKQNALLKRIVERKPESEHEAGIPADPAVLLLLGGSWGKSLATRLIPMALSQIGRGTLTALTPLPQDPEGSLDLDPRAVAAPFATVVIENVETAQRINARFVANLAHLLETGLIALVDPVKKAVQPLPLGLTTFILTSSIADHEIREALNPETRLGFLPKGHAVDSAQMYDAIQRICLRALEYLPAELLRQVDDTVILRPLGEDDLRQVFELEIAYYTQAVFPGRALRIAFEGDAKDELFAEAQTGLGTYGTHALRRVLQRHIDPVVYRAYNEGALTEDNFDEHTVMVRPDAETVRVSLE